MERRRQDAKRKREKGIEWLSAPRKIRCFLFPSSLLGVPGVLAAVCSPRSLRLCGEPEFLLKKQMQPKKNID
jgi:hypothetical protein